eukprot:TRINITY_DN12145_c0_g2_i7.p2 TRINITY_DN12145_c0_g2~~TRINITY_DN12145_c0_g2_i7.p2  ORF type:complete len:304 (-),score=66.04 TRINITY_DN12145_c0_g2_i7:1917-2828(-)
MAEKAALQVEAEEKSCEHGATNPANTHSLDDEQHERILQNLFESSNAQEVLLHFDNDWLDALLSVLNDSQYVPISGRKFLLCLVETFGSVCDQLSPKDLENLRLELSKKTSANPYLSQNIRRDALLLLNSCKAFLLRKGYEEEPHGLWCKNGSLTQKVLDILNPLKKANMIESFRKVSVGNERIIVIGVIDPETFMKKMEVLGANSDKISLQLPRSDESFRFNDPFLPCFTVLRSNHSLFDTNRFSRGLAAAVVRLNGDYYVLTCASVAFPRLREDTEFALNFANYFRKCFFFQRVRLCISSS